jgi:hypothetical protein
MPLLQRIRVWWTLWRVTRQKTIWRCVREGGGGIVITPRRMRRDQAVKWFRESAGGHAEIIYVDDINSHIFYRS